MESIKKILGDLHSTEQEVLSALETLIDSLSKDTSIHVKQEVFRSGVAKAVIGLLRCCFHPPTVKTACHVISMLAYGCPQARQRMASMGVVEILLQLLKPNIRRGLGLHVDTSCKQWLEVCEEAVVALQKLSYKCDEIQKVLVRYSGVGAVANMCNDTRLVEEWANFPDGAYTTMKQLVEGKLLIARGARVTDGEDKETLLSEFPVLNKLLSGVKESYPAFMVDLIDGSKQWIADSMVEQGMAWPDSIVFPDTSNPMWVVVRGVHVEETDPRYVWCVFSPDKTNPATDSMWQSLRSLALPPAPPLSIDLTPDTVYAVYCEKEDWWAGPQWCRGWLLNEDHTFFLLDFGFTITVPVTHILPLPPSCCGVPPQAVPCEAIGFSPLSSAIILENSAALLRNIAFESDAYRMEVKSCGGVEVLLALCHCPVGAVRIQALGALVNLSQCDAICNTMRDFHAVELIMSVFEAHTKADDSSDEGKLAIGCLQNLVIGDEGCLHELVSCGGHQQLLEMIPPEWRPLPEYISTFVQTIETLTGKKLPASNTPTPGSKKRSPHSKKKCHFHLLSEKALYTITTPTTQTPVMQEEEEPALVDGQKLPERFVKDLLITTFFELQALEGNLMKVLCGLANTNRLSALYVGVHKSSSVVGVPLTKLQRDRLRLKIDEAGSSLYPVLSHDTYKVTFIPVLKKRQTAQQYWMVCIKLFPKYPRHVYVHKKKESKEVCYYHMAGSTLVLSLRDIRDQIAIEEAQKQQREAEELRKTIEALKLVHVPLSPEH